MKRILAALLSISILLGSFPAYAETNNYPKNNKPIRIICNENSADEMCKALEITKTEVPLESYLKRNYKAYTYTVKNSSGENIEITKIYGFNSPKQAIKQIQNKRIRLHKVLSEIQILIVDLPVIVIGVPRLIDILCAYGENDNKDNSASIVTATVAIAVSSNYL